MRSLAKIIIKSQVTICKWKRLLIMMSMRTCCFTNKILKMKYLIRTVNLATHPAALFQKKRSTPSPNLVANKIKNLPFKTNFK